MRRTSWSAIPNPVALARKPAASRSRKQKERTPGGPLPNRDDNAATRADAGYLTTLRLAGKSFAAARTILARDGRGVGTLVLRAPFGPLRSRRRSTARTPQRRAPMN